MENNKKKNIQLSFDMKSVLLNPKSEAKLEVSQATEILNLFALSNNDKKTREYVNKGSAKGNKLVAIPKGKSLEDRRMGYSIQVSHLISFINAELPGVLYLYQNLGKKAPTSKAAPKETPENK